MVNFLYGFLKKLLLLQTTSWALTSTSVYFFKHCHDSYHLRLWCWCATRSWSLAAAWWWLWRYPACCPFPTAGAWRSRALTTTETLACSWWPPCTQWRPDQSPLQPETQTWRQTNSDFNPFWLDPLITDCQSNRKWSSSPCSVLLDPPIKTFFLDIWKTPTRFDHAFFRESNIWLPEEAMTETRWGLLNV